MRRKQRHITALLIGLAFLSACDSTTREARRMVKRAEQLADTLPDSTVRLIDSVLRMPASFSQRERMDMALLQAEALFGDRGQEISPVMDDDFFDEHANLSTSPELERAAAYYAGKKQYAKAAHAALYSGFVQQHYDEKEAAMRSFKEAEQYGKLAVDSITVARTNYWMGKLLHNEYMEQEAMDLLQKSESYIGNHFIERASIENSKAVIYILAHHYDSAELCLQQSLMHAEKGHSDKVLCRIHNNYSVLYRLQSKYDQAINCLYQMLDDPNLDDSEQLMFYLNIGQVYFDMNVMDSSALYYQRMETLLPTVRAKKETLAAAYEALSRFAERKGLAPLALEYRERHERVLYDLMVQRQKQTIYRIQQQFDYESLQNKMNRKINRTQRIIAIGAVLFLCVIALFLFRSFKRSKREAEANANLFHFMQQNKTLVESNMAKDQKVHDTTQQLSDLLHARLMAMIRFDYCLKNQKDKIALKDLEKEVFGDEDHWEAIKEVLDSLYPSLWETIGLKYPSMDEMERRVCMLSRLKLSRLGESTVLGISTSVLDKLRTKVRKTVEQEGKQ